MQEALLTGGDHERGFDALNGAFADCGAVIKVPAGRQISEPGSGVCERRPSARSHDQPAPSSSTLVTVQVSIWPKLICSARDLDYSPISSPAAGLGRTQIFVMIACKSAASMGDFIGRFYTDIGERAKLTQTLATLGGGFVRNEIAARLNGSEIEAQFNGLYLTRAGQHVDNMLVIDHTAPGSVSDQYYKGVLDGRAKAAFAGKIHVHQAAQQTNAYQTNNNLLLSPDAEINTKPELEIYADDVKCSHGATAGELDERELFYLRSRGLDPEIARTMLTFAFADEVLERFASKAMLTQAKREILRWLPGAEILGDMGEIE